MLCGGTKGLWVGLCKNIGRRGGFLFLITLDSLWGTDGFQDQISSIIFGVELRLFKEIFPIFLIELLKTRRHLWQSWWISVWFTQWNVNFIKAADEGEVGSFFRFL